MPGGETLRENAQQRRASNKRALTINFFEGGTPASGGPDVHVVVPYDPQTRERLGFTVDLVTFSILTPGSTDSEVQIQTAADADTLVWDDFGTPIALPAGKHLVSTPVNWGPLSSRTWVRPNVLLVGFGSAEWQMVVEGFEISRA